MNNDWTLEAAKQICKRFESDRSDVHKVQQIIIAMCPFKQGVAYAPVEPPKVKVAR